MKCDELKAYGMADPAIGDEYEMYKVTEVDEAIAELKAEVNNLLIQNRELCQALHAMYSVEEYTELKVENRRLRRALWLARAKSAENAVTTWCRGCMERWNNVERKCLKKAEEYR